MDPQVLGKEFIIFNNKLNQEAFIILIVYLNNKMFIMRKTALVGIYKHPNCIKYKKTIYYKKDCWERNPENILKNIGNKICARKKQRTTRLPI